MSALDAPDVIGWFLEVGTANFGFSGRREHAEQVLRQQNGMATPLMRDRKLGEPIRALAISSKEGERE